MKEITGMSAKFIPPEWKVDIAEFFEDIKKNDLLLAGVMFGPDEWRKYFGTRDEAVERMIDYCVRKVGTSKEKIMYLFKMTALYDPRLDSDYYLRKLISKSILELNGINDGTRLEVPCFITFTGKSERLLPSGLAKYMKENLQHVLVHDPAEDTYSVYAYDDGRYVRMSRDSIRCCMQREIEKYDRTLISLAPMNEAADLLCDQEEYCDKDQLDAEEDIINFENGLLRIYDDGFVLSGHDPLCLSTVRIPCRWTETAEATPVFDAFLDRLTGGQKDVQQLLLEYMGACISNVKGWRMKKALFMVGPGNTGKSVLLNLTQRLLGNENYMSMDLEGLEDRFSAATLEGKRLVGTADMGFMSVKELRTFKMLTGGDSITAEAKYCQPSHFIYNGLLWFAMNRLPKFGGDDGQWVYDRIMIVQCDNVIPPEERDSDIIEKLYAERDGIVRKAVEALQTVIRNGYRFTEPCNMLQVRDKYRFENNSALRFYYECMEIKTGAYLDRYADTTSRIYKVYLAWCKNEAIKVPKGSREFRESIAGLVTDPDIPLIIRKSYGSVYRDLKLKEEVAKEYEFV